MKLVDIVAKLELKVACCPDLLDRPVVSGYASDMLSDVLANATADTVWITRQAHQNVVAVASLLGLAAIILVNCPPPSAAMLAKAEEERIPVLISSLSAYEVSGHLFALGLVGSKRD